MVGRSTMNGESATWVRRSSDFIDSRAVLEEIPGIDPEAFWSENSLREVEKGLVRRFSGIDEMPTGGCPFPRSSSRRKDPRVGGYPTTG